MYIGWDFLGQYEITMRRLPQATDLNANCVLSHYPTNREVYAFLFLLHHKPLLDFSTSLGLLNMLTYCLNFFQLLKTLISLHHLNMTFDTQSLPLADQ